MDLFCERYVCVKGIAVTDVFDIPKSKTVTKLELNDIVEVLSSPQAAKGNGLLRVECKLVDRGVVGWVTMKGNQGTVYLEPFSPYSSWSKAISESLDQIGKDIPKAHAWMKEKARQLDSLEMPSTKRDLLKLRPRISEAQKSLDDLKEKVAQAQT